MPIPWPKQSVTLDDIKSCAELTFDVIPCLFQAQACQLQLERKHTILISPTGSGKSITFLLPFLWQAEGVCIVICPLQLLGNQHSLHPALEGLGVEAINLTSETATDQAFKDIANGKYRLVITSPEYVEEDTRFETYLWKSTRFCERVTRIVFDEAHCVLDWGGFRPSYKRLCFLHNQIQHATFLALSATLTPRMVEQLKCSLGLGDDVEVIRYPNDRPNIIPVVHRMQHSAESMFDVAFLIPLGLTADSPFPPKFLLFMKSKDLCKDAGKFLRSRLPEELQDHVVWVHADMTQEFCKKALEDLRAGRIYGIVCTDVVGMGIDISDIELVVQFQLPGKFCTLFQRFGRCARSVAMVAIAILIVESKYFDDTKKRLEEQATKRQERAARKRKADESLDVGLGDEVSEVKSEVVGESSTSRTGSGKPTNPPKSQHKRALSVEEVMDEFINSHLRHTSTPRSGCRRVPGNQFFANPAVPQEGSDKYCCARCCRPPPPASKCCDVCNPDVATLLMTVADPPPKAKRAPNQMHLPSEDPAQWSSVDQALQEALEIWRDEEATAQWGRHHMIGGKGILGDDQIKRIAPLARRGTIQTLENLKWHMPKWHFHDRYGPQILKLVLAAYPIQRETQTTQSSSTSSEAPPSGPALKKPRAQVHCGVCGEPGHNSRNVLKCGGQKQKRQDMIQKASEAAPDSPFIFPFSTPSGSLRATSLSNLSAA